MECEVLSNSLNVPGATGYAERLSSFRRRADSVYFRGEFMEFECRDDLQTLGRHRLFDER
jgi:hypothetical protein